MLPYIIYQFSRGALHRKVTALYFLLSPTLIYFGPVQKCQNFSQTDLTIMFQEFLIGCISRVFQPLKMILTSFNPNFVNFIILPSSFMKPSFTFNNKKRHLYAFIYYSLWRTQDQQQHVQKHTSTRKILKTEYE